jgi:cytochrome P450
LCIKEALRLHTPVHLVMRQTTSDIDTGVCSIPAGTTVQLNIYNLHHNPAVWDEPMEFRPDRFRPENMEGKDTFSYVPFSAGPRYVFRPQGRLVLFSSF